MNTLPLESIVVKSTEMVVKSIETVEELQLLDRPRG